MNSGNLVDLSAIILAGGESRRMGTNKALINYQGKALIEYPINLATQFTSRVLLSANSHSLDYLGYPVIRDILPVRAAIAGIHAGLSSSESEWNLVLTCDNPNISHSLIRHLIDNLSASSKIVIPVHHGYPEPLCGIYHQSLTDTIERNVETGKFSLLNLIAVVPHKLVIPEIDNNDDLDVMFKNINEPKDLED